MFSKQGVLIAFTLSLCGVGACLLVYFLFIDVAALFVAASLSLTLCLFLFKYKSSKLSLKQIILKEQVGLIAEKTKTFSDSAFSVFLICSCQQNVSHSKLQSKFSYVFSHAHVSIKKLKKHRWSVTISGVKETREVVIQAKLSALVNSDLKQCYFGACFYREPCQQLNVYQLAELSLAIAKTKTNSFAHVLKLNQTNLALLQYSLSDMLRYILNKQFLLIFKTVFSIHGEALLLHRVEITVRHHKVGLCDAKQLLLGCFDRKKLRELDLHVLNQLIYTLAQDSSNEPVLLCLDLCTWQSERFMRELIETIKISKLQDVIRFSISENNLLELNESFTKQLALLRSHGIDIFVERCSGALLQLNTELSFLTGIYLDSDILNQKSEEQTRMLLALFSEFAMRYRLVVYCAGVETSKQLAMLADFNIEGASGSYFQYGESDSALGLN